LKQQGADDAETEAREINPHPPDEKHRCYFTRKPPEPGVLEAPIVKTEKELAERGKGIARTLKKPLS
jgi:hypothetical protein